MHKPIILAIDGAGAVPMVAIARGDKDLAYIRATQRNSHAEKLLLMTQQALEQAGLLYSDINYIAANIGPGSFTGIRAGLAAANGLAAASGNNAKLIGITSFELSLYRATRQYKGFNANNIYIMLEAMRGELYMQSYDAKLNIVSTELIKIDQAEAIIKQSAESGNKVMIAGSGICRVFPQLKEQENLLILPRFPAIKPTYICRIAQQKLGQAQRPLPAALPLYIRPPDAVVQN